LHWGALASQHGIFASHDYVVRRAASLRVEIEVDVDVNKDRKYLLSEAFSVEDFGTFPKYIVEESATEIVLMTLVK
jgi:hypothetical protein